MKRRLVKQGSTTLTMSVPARWARRNKLSAGDDVTVIEEQNTLRVSAGPGQRANRTIDKDVRGLSEAFLSDLVQCLYKKGFDELRLRCDKPQISIVQRLLQHALLGFEIVEQGPDRLVVRFVTRVEESELDGLLRRLFLVTLSLAEGLTEQREDIDDLLILEETTDRLANYCENILIKHIASREDAIFIYQLAAALERVADEFRRVVEGDDPATADAEVCFDLLRRIYDLHYSYDGQVHDSILADLRHSRRLLYERGSPLAAVLHVTQQLMEPITALHA